MISEAWPFRLLNGKIGMLLRDLLTVGKRTLNPSILVQIQVPQPSWAPKTDFGGQSSLFLNIQTCKLTLV